ncbi:hypothetical protein QFC19_003595 [Naganishia cerealis]|uniref:Uncharacterized protein n=1 Tax=Naganishia cerealis TaxID=610337 RepID=A0ACC2W3B7_9TREE|nr:hypothetical protein QFC19_003595 [Naganishia cerealis]
MPKIDLTSILESTIDHRTLTTVRPDRAVSRGTYPYTFHPEYKPYGPHYTPHALLDAIGRWLGGTRSFEPADAKALATKPGVQPVRQERNLLDKYNRERRGKGLPYWAPRPENLVQAIKAIRDQVRQRSDAKYQKAIRRQAGSHGAGSAEYSRVDQLEEGHLDEADLEHATLLDWCQEFCRSSQPLKEFRIYKNVYGWEFDSLHVGECLILYLYPGK